MLEDLNKVIKYISNPPRLCTYPLTIFNDNVFDDNDQHQTLDQIHHMNLEIGFGCEHGSYDELIKLKNELENVKF
jgi:hypothetical protein